MKPDEVVHGIGAILVIVGSVLFMTADIIRLHYNDVNDVSTPAGEILPGFSSVMLAVGFLVLLGKHAMEVKDRTINSLPKITLLVSFMFLTAAFTMMGIDSFESSKPSFFSNTAKVNATCYIFEYPGLFDVGFSGNAMNDFIAVLGLSLVPLSLLFHYMLSDEAEGYNQRKEGEYKDLGLLCLSFISFFPILAFYGMEMHDNGSNSFGETNGYTDIFDDVWIKSSNRQYGLLCMAVFSLFISGWFLSRKTNKSEKLWESVLRVLAFFLSLSFFVGALVSAVQSFTSHYKPLSPLLSCDDDFFSHTIEGEQTQYFVGSGFMSTAAVLVSVLSITAMTIVFPEENKGPDVNYTLD